MQRSVTKTKRVFPKRLLTAQALGEDRHRYRAPLSKALSVQLDALNLVQCFGRQVTFPAVWATDDRDVLDDE